MSLIQKAIEFGANKHRGQERRVSKLPYIIHPISVAFYVMEYAEMSTGPRHFDSIICASILHDTLEDTDTTYDELESEFDSLTAHLVDELTSDKEEIKRLGSKNRYLINKMMSMTKQALIIKLCDRLSNINDNPTEKYMEDTMEMMIYLTGNCHNISETHLQIIKDITETIRKTIRNYS